MHLIRLLLEDDNYWASSKWAPKKLGSDNDLIKATYDNLFYDAFKTFPKPLQHWFQDQGYQGGSGNGIFDAFWSQIGHEFEDEFCRDKSGDPDELYEILINMGATAKLIIDALDKMKPAYDAFQNLPSKTTLAKCKQAHKKLLGLELTIGRKGKLSFSTANDLKSPTKFDEYPVHVHWGDKLLYKKQAFAFNSADLFTIVWDAFAQSEELYFLLVEKTKVTVKTIAQPQPTDEMFIEWGFAE